MQAINVGHIAAHLKRFCPFPYESGFLARARGTSREGYDVIGHNEFDLEAAPGSFKAHGVGETLTWYYTDDMSAKALLLLRHQPRF